MKKVLIVLGVIVAVLAVALTLLGLLGKKEMTFERSTVVAAPREFTFTYLSDLQKHELWSPWQEADSTVRNTYTGAPATVGQTAAWVGDPKQIGTGNQTLTSIVEDEKVSFDLNFEKPQHSSADYSLIAKDTTGGTKISWTFHTKFDFVSRIFMTFFDLEKMLSKDYERGLVLLKKQVETDFSIVPQATPEPKTN